MMPEHSRPSPEQLLAQARREEGQAARGRLKIFFGAAPGVGKTFAMLAAAQRLARDGVDVVIGLVETHGRRETEEQLLGLDILPRRAVEYRGAKLREFDLDAAVARRPEILVLDELAHTNAPGSRFEKRWQDVQELLKAGINVYSTLNVQHIETLNDIVAQITGVKVRETVPDSVVEEADEIELVDLPPDALLDRLKAGRVYVPEQIAAATDSFFRKGNLTALRELALRRTAEWVDQRMRQYKSEQGIRTVWPAADRILVCIGPAPSSATLLRAAKRMASGLRADLLAVYVERTDRSLSAADRDRVLETLRLAESMGAETITLPVHRARDAVHEVVSLARARNANKIVVGKTRRSRLAVALLGSFMDDLIRASGEINVYAMQGEEESPAAATDVASPRTASSRSVAARVRAYAGAILVVAAAAGVAWWAFRPPDLSEEAMILIAGVVVAAFAFGRSASVIASVFAVLAFNYLFTEPRFTFFFNDPGYLITFGVMLVVGLLVGNLAARTKDQAEEARRRASRSAALYALAKDLSSARDPAQVAAVAVGHISGTIRSDAVVIPMSSDPGLPEPLAHAGSPDWLNDRERSVARWVLDNGKAAGVGTRVLPGGAGRFLPINASQGRRGALGLRISEHASDLQTSELLLLETMADLTGQALERVGLLEGRQQARVEAEAERLRSALLSSVSHDLRTPLATIAGAASTLAESDGRIDAATRHELAQSIVSEAQRLNDLVANLVFATRLESGIQLRREWTSVEEIIGSGLARHREALTSRPFSVLLPPGLPLLRVDNAMLPQVVHNLVENALRYTPHDARISVIAWVAEGRVVVRVSDEGPGLDETELAKVFQRFYRGRAGASGVADRAGLGLGLTICEGIIRAHAGRIWAEPNRPRGVSFLFSLPVDQPQPTVPTEQVA
ncbi:two-component system, OmpR family, sensor histidine kinase KdpD [Phycisphaerales bacterium]|nr:two-component system, OmpR family, sensor histidine kinase KdpD [Phycisphaerales bacterium]